GMLISGDRIADVFGRFLARSGTRALLGEELDAPAAHHALARDTCALHQALDLLDAVLVGGVAEVETDDDCGSGVERRWGGLLHQFGVFDTGWTKG
ncbi:MAG: hypothetical protein ACREUK_04150, partial [Burkholderiales bacterium]